MKPTTRILSLALSTLFVFSSCGGDDVDLGGPFISVQPSTTSGVAPLSVSFETFVLAEDDFRVAIDFGDGVSSTFPNPTHTYTGPGMYTAVFTVTDEDGNTDETTVDIEVVADEVPEASASSDVTSGQEPLEVAFSCEGSGGNGELSILWDFGDGKRSPLADPQHRYEKAGDYVAACIVTDEQGDFDIDRISITVTPDTVPVVEITSSSRAGIADSVDGFTVDFGAVVNGGEPEYTYAWDFGDNIGTSTAPSPSYTYNNAGQYAVTLTVTDSDGDAGTATVDIAVATDSLPAVSIVGTPASGIEDLFVQFDADVAGGNAPLSFSWTFGDGGTSLAQNPNHIYTTTGLPATFTATITVTDVDGDTASDTFDIAVEPDQDVEAIAGSDETDGVTPMPVLFTSDTLTGNAPFTYLWDFGDGTTSTLQNPSHVYTVAGSYVPVVTITDADGDSDEALVGEITVAEDSAPQVVAVASPQVGVDSTFVDLDALVTGGNGTLSFEWDFGDGSPTENAQSPAPHEYSEGTFTAIIRVTDEDGDVGFDTIDIAIATDEVPAVVIEATPVSGIEPLLVDFTASLAGGNAPVSFEWNFGDGGVSFEQNPSHTYAAGNHTAVLLVTDADGDTRLTQVDINVDADQPVQLMAAILALPAAGLAPLQVDYLLAADGNAPLSYHWEFGDGSTSTLEDPRHTFTEPGIYAAAVTVTDADGDSETFFAPTVTVEEDTAPVVTIAPVSAGGLDIIANIQTAGGNLPLASQVINWGDGTPTEDVTNQFMFHTYPIVDLSPYTITVTTTDADGDTTFATAVVD